MSLMQLLTLGKSLMGFRSEISRYKMTEEHLLPKFVPVHKQTPPPLSSDPNPPHRELSFTRFSEKPSEPPSSGRSSPPPTPQEEARRKPAQIEPSFKRVQVAAPKGKSFFRRVFCAESAVRSPLELVQTEFALGHLKVVRNDLSDADVEVVPAPAKRKAVDQASQNPGLPPREAPAPGARWSQLTARLAETSNPQLKI